MPEPLFCAAPFDVYKSVSQQIREIFTDYTALIEALSLDEAYLDVTENFKGMEVATQIALEIRAKIEQVTGLNASAGISYNTFLAKMASDLNKPNGQAVITPKNGAAFVEALAVTKFHGVGPAAAARVKEYGIETGVNLKSKSLRFLAEKFGKSGPYFCGIARGIDHRQVGPDRIRKSVGAEDTSSRILMTMAVHHIPDAQVADAALWKAVAPGVLRPPGVVALAAHRAAFEQRYCTPRLIGALDLHMEMRVARMADASSIFPPDAALPKHAGWLGPRDRVAAKSSHALAVQHLRDLLNTASLEQRLAWSTEPGLLPRVPSGPDRGKERARLCERALKEFCQDRDVDVRFSAQIELVRRGDGHESCPVEPLQGTLL